MDLLWVYHASILYNEGGNGRIEAKGVDMNDNLTPGAPPLNTIFLLADNAPRGQVW